MSYCNFNKLIPYLVHGRTISGQTYRNFNNDEITNYLSTKGLRVKYDFINDNYTIT